MLKYLSALRNKKGFTMVELVVVVAIIAVLSSMLLITFIDRDSAKQLEYNANAQAFMSATQVAVTRIQFTERDLIKNNADLMVYENGAMKMKDDKYLFIEAKFKGNGVQYLHLAADLPTLMAMPETNYSELEQYVAQQILNNITDSYEGYFYAAIDNNFKVLSAHFSEYRLPAATVGEGAAYRDKLIFTEGSKVGGHLVGSCNDEYTIAPAGVYAFAAPDDTLYFG